MIDILLSVLVILLAIFFFITIGSSGIDDGSYHVSGPTDPYCPTCNGVCEEYQTAQTNLHDFDG